MKDLDEFIEKYKAVNFDSYKRDDATIEYWQELIINYDIDRLNFTGFNSFLITLNPVLRVGNLDGIDFKKFCENQIKEIEIRNQFKVEQTVLPVGEFVHSAYFKGDAFKIWEEMFKAFNIPKDCKESVDLDFMFYAMKAKGLIHETITQGKMKYWIATDFGIENLSKMRFTNINSKANEDRMYIFNRITE